MPLRSSPPKFYAEAQERCITWAKHFGYLRAQREGDAPTRWNEWVEANKTAPPMPDLGHLSFMAGLFAKSGRFTRGSMDISPLSYQELEAFARIEVGVSVDDIRLLREMSVGFVEWLSYGKDVFCNPPWDGD